MAARNLFTPEEITLCTYAAIYEAADFGGESKIEKLTHRSPSSIRLKIQNIASMLDQAGIQRQSSATPYGQSGRTTNWEIVEPLTKLEQPAFLEECRGILARVAVRG
jgi:hypothetical protein